MGKWGMCLPLAMTAGLTACSLPGLFTPAGQETKLNRVNGGVALTKGSDDPGATSVSVNGRLKLVTAPAAETLINVDVAAGKVLGFQPATGPSKLAWKVKLEGGVKDVVVARVRFALLVGDADPAEEKASYALTQFMPPAGAPGGMPAAGGTTTTTASSDPNAPGSTGSVGTTDGGATTTSPGSGPGGGVVGGAPAGVTGPTSGTGAIGGTSDAGGQLAGPPGVNAGVPGGSIGGGVPGFAVPPSIDPSALPSSDAAGGPPTGLGGLAGGTAIPGGVALPGGVAGPTVVSNGVGGVGIPTPAPTPQPGEPVIGADGKEVATPGEAGDFLATLIPSDLLWPARLAPNEEVELALPFDNGQVRRFVEYNLFKAKRTANGEFAFRVRIRLVGDNERVLLDQNQLPLELRATIVAK